MPGRGPSDAPSGAKTFERPQNPNANLPRDQWRSQGGAGGASCPPWKNLGGNFGSEYMVEVVHDL